MYAECSYCNNVRIQKRSSSRSLFNDSRKCSNSHVFSSKRNSESNSFIPHHTYQGKFLNQESWDGNRIVRPKRVHAEKSKKTLSTDDLAPHVERILTAVVNWKPETRNPFRLKVRRLLERLVKKFGFDIIQKFVPEKSPIAKAGFSIQSDWTIPSANQSF